MSFIVGETSSEALHFVAANTLAVNDMRFATYPDPGIYELRAYIDPQQAKTLLRQAAQQFDAVIDLMKAPPEENQNT